jgi:hypothetical protein
MAFQLVTGHRISRSSSLAIFFCFKYPIIPPIINSKTDTPANAPITLGRVEDGFGEVDASALGVNVSVAAAEVDVSVAFDVSDGEMVDIAESGADELENDGDDDGVGIVYVDAEEEDCVVIPEREETEYEVETRF